MAYTKSWDPTRYEMIAKIISRVESLPKGGKIKVGSLERRQLVQARGKLYDWLKHMGTTRSFRVKTNWSKGELVIENIEWPNTAEVSVELPRDVKFASLIEKLVVAEEPWDLVKQWIGEKKISTKEGAELLGRLEEILS